MAPAHRLASGQPPSISYSQEDNKLSSSTASTQSEFPFTGTPDHRIDSRAPPQPPPTTPSLPSPIHLRIAVPATAWVISRYCLLHSVMLIKTSTIKDLLKLENPKPINEAIRWLVRHGVLRKASKKGYYICDLARAFYVTHLPPYPIGSRKYGNLEAKLRLPEWLDVQLALCEWVKEIQGTRGSCRVIKPSGTPSGASPPSVPPHIEAQSQAPAVAGYPRPVSGLTVVRLRVPSGYCLPAVATHYLDGTPMYIFLHGLLRPGATYPRQDAYCVRISGALYCFAKRELLRRYMSPPCPSCPPVVSSPTPCEGEVPATEPVIDNLRADGTQSLGLVPYSQAPERFAYGEPGVHYRPGNDSYSLLADSVTYLKHGALVLRPTARSILPVWRSLRHPSTFLTALLEALGTALVKTNEFGKSFLGLTTPQLMAQGTALIERVLRYKHRKAKATTPVPYLKDVTIDLYVRAKVPTNGTVIRERYQWVKVGTITYKRITLRGLYDEIDRYTSQGYYLIPQDYVLVLPLLDIEGLSYVSEVYDSLRAMYLKVYRNQNKDRPGTIRIEGVPTSGTVRKLTKRELFTLYFAQLHGLGYLIAQGHGKLVRLWLEGLAGTAGTKKERKSLNLTKAH